LAQIGLEDQRSLNVRIVLGLAILYLVWGSVYLAVKEAVNYWPPFLMVGIRFFIAGLTLLIWARFRQKPWPDTWKQWRNVCFVGFLMVTGTNGAITWGIQYVDSGLASVLVATMPLWLILLESMRPSGDRPHYLAFVGIALGLVGVVMLVQPNIGVPENTQTLMGQIAILGAAVAWASGSIFMRQFVMPPSVVMGTALQMTFGGFILVLIGLSLGETQYWPTQFKWIPVLAFLYMTFISSVIAYSSYQWLIRNTRPALVATYAYVNPVVAISLGVWIGQEILTLNIFLGSTLVLIAAFLIQRVRH